MTGQRPPEGTILAVDGGASKADVALVDRAGRVLGAARRMGPTNVGLSMEASTQVIAEAVDAVSRQAGLRPKGRPLAQTGVFCLAGADFPVDDRRISRALAGRSWAGTFIVRNDTFAVLRAGTDRGWGVAVVCGTGMNCVGLAPDGRAVRFPALGELSGDWAAGGAWIGNQALGAAVRARDWRGEHTLLERTVPTRLGLSRPAAVMEAIHRGRLGESALLELTPLVFEAAGAGDGVAQSILERQADEVVAWAVAAIRRLRLVSSSVDVVLGGGVFRADHPPFLHRIEAGVTAAAPRASVRKVTSPPVVGAALIGLDAVRASGTAAARLRAALPFERLDGEAGRHRGP